MTICLITATIGFVVATSDGPAPRLPTHEGGNTQPAGAIAPVPGDPPPPQYPQVVGGVSASPVEAAPFGDGPSVGPFEVNPDPSQVVQNLEPAPDDPELQSALSELDKMAERDERIREQLASQPPPAPADGLSPPVDGLPPPAGASPSPPADVPPAPVDGPLHSDHGPPVDAQDGQGSLPGVPANP